VSKAWWIILPNVRARAAWISAIRSSTDAKGLRLVDWDQAPDRSALAHADVVAVTRRPEAAVAAGSTPDRTTVLLGSSAPDFDSFPPGGDRHALLAQATLPMAQAQAASALVRITERDLTSGSVELAPGLHVEPPTVSPSSPLARGLQLFGPADVRTTWGPEFFAYDERNTELATTTGEIDITGRPRFLIYGPYIVLPPGRWKAIFRLSFDQTGAQRRFRLDWGAQKTFDSEEFTPGRAGLYEIEMDYVWTEPAPAEFRIVSLEGVFDGRMTFGGVQVSRVPEDR